MPGKRNKYRSSLFIRLIDVVLILLFGFIAISEIDIRSQIKLAKSTTVPVTAPDREVVIYVGVLPDGRYLVEKESRMIEQPKVLAGYLQNKQSEFTTHHKRLKIRIRTNYDAPVKYAFAVVNICQELGIPVGLDVVHKKGERGKLAPNFTN